MWDDMERASNFPHGTFISISWCEIEKSFFEIPLWGSKTQRIVKVLIMWKVMESFVKGIYNFRSIKIAGISRRMFSILKRDLSF